MRTFSRSTLAVLGAGGLLAAALGTALPAQAADGDFTNPDNGNTSTYQSVPGSYTWDEARDAAASTEAPKGCTNHLAVITSQAEQDYINAYLGDQPRQFIGGSRNDNGDFQWVTNEKFGYTNWAGGEPNNTNPGEPYIQFAGSQNLWNDIFSDTTSGYILETECDAETPPPPPPAPQRAEVISVDPNSGPASGGTTVVITGDHFTGTKLIKFGPFKVKKFTVDSDDQITATAPVAKLNGKNRPRTVDVRVKTVDAPSAKSAGDRYTYTPDPVVS